MTNERVALEAAAEAISDLLTMLGVDPDDRGNQGDDGSGHYPPYNEDAKTIIASAAIHTWQATTQRWTPERLAGLAFLAGGAATAPLLADHPGYVFPAERVAARVADVLREHGIEPNDIPGYNVRESDPGDYLGDIEIAGSSQPLDPS